MKKRELPFSLTVISFNGLFLPICLLVSHAEDWKTIVYSVSVSVAFALFWKYREKEMRKKR